jgi:cytochrome c peroxidase
MVVTAGVGVKMRPKYVARILFMTALGLAASAVTQAQTASKKPSPSNAPTPAAANAKTSPAAAASASNAAPSTKAMAAASPSPTAEPPALGAGDGGPLADPEPAKQAGFPHDLYRWVLPTDNLERPPEKIALGRALFFDRRLSLDMKESCSTCHDPEKGFTDQLPTSMGIHNQFGKRNAPTIVNATFNILQFWDGREPTLEDQAKRPILNPIELGMPDEKSVVERLNSAPEYQKAFMEVFGHRPNFEDMAKAIASYERTQVAFDSPFDKFMEGDDKALTEQQKHGWSIFNGKGRCMSCHGVNAVQPLFTDNRFHNIGVSAHDKNFIALARKGLAIVAQGGGREEIDRVAIQTDLSELGRFLVTEQPHDIGAFRTMGLRNLLVTEPYFHDGSQATLWDTIDHYNKGGVRNPYLDGGITPLGLSEQEIDDLVAFLKSLTSPRYADAAEHEYTAQLARSKTDRPQRDVDAAMGIKGRNDQNLSGPFGDIGPDMDQMKEDPALLGNE